MTKRRKRILEASEIKPLTVQLGIVDTAGPICYNSFCVRYACLCSAFSSNDENPSCSSLDILHTPQISSKLNFSMDTSRQ